MLRTHDGGQHWQSEPRLLLPSLHYVRFVNATHGWAIGQRSALFASSIFITEDGGRSWNALPAGDDASWTTADFVDGQTGALAGEGGKLSYVRRKTAEQAKTANLGLRRSALTLSLRVRAVGWSAMAD